MATKSQSSGNHEAKKKAFRKNSDSLLDCFKTRTESIAFALCANGLITREQRSGSAAEIVDGLELRLGYQEDVWEKLLAVLKGQDEGVMSRMLQNSLEEEFALFVPNGQSPVHRSFFDAFLSTRHSDWIPSTRPSVTQPGDVLSSASYQRVCSNRTGEFTRDQSSRSVYSDSAIHGFNGMT